MSRPGWYLCISGGTFAVRRAKESLSSDKGTDGEALKAICEAIWWAACADEMLKGTHKGYKDLRSKAGFADRMDGLVWVRNRITHQEAQWSIISPPFHWAPDTKIPTNPKKDNNRAKYKAKLAGHEIIPFLEELLRELKESGVKVGL